MLKCLVAVAWADGKVQAPEEGMIDALLWAFGASDAEEVQLRDYASKKRKLQDVSVNDLIHEERETLLAHAALLTHADGKQTPAEVKLLEDLVALIGLGKDQAQPIIENARDKAARLAEKLG